MVFLHNVRVRTISPAPRASANAGALGRRPRAHLLASALAAACACGQGDSSASPAATARATGDATFVPASTAAPRAASSAPSPTPRSGGATIAARAPGSPEALARYPWLSERKLGWPEPAGRLSERIAPPSGFARVPLAPESFGAWLRELPLAAEGAEVRSFRGGLVREAGHPNVAAVVALDVGNEDVQQCADSIMRLHAEWRWSRGDRAMSYRAASGVAMPYERWARGERPRAEGLSLRWEPRAAAGGGYPSFRAYLNEVFRYANTGSLAAQGARVAPDDLRPGDFFVLPGAPGHAVLVVDVAVDGAGRRAALLAQGFMPAQNVHVLRPDAPAAVTGGGAWFLLDPASSGVKTPFWPTFGWTSLRRLDG
jgi:uncharacterized protein DUF4846